MRKSNVFAAIAIAALVSAAASAQFDLSWNTIDGGGATFSTGSGFELGGTIGQPDASAGLTGGGFELIGGFWPGAAAANIVVLGDMNCDGVVNNFDIDPFVLALTDPALYARMYPGCNIENGDVNQDGVLNNFDIDPFVACLTSGGC
ncbi:MAG: hypothetical protein JNG88_00410 [Phycisphaerales bacterium]|nr:hypothetical protein [Phycisphaerales bacterium]